MKYTLQLTIKNKENYNQGSNKLKYNKMKLIQKFCYRLIKGVWLCFTNFVVALSGKKRIAIISFLMILIVNLVSAQENYLVPGSVFREYTYAKRASPFKGDYAAYDSFQVVLNIDDLKDATSAEMALNFWGGHIGTSDQTFKVNGSKKYSFPQPHTPGSPYCYYRCVLGNPPVAFPPGLLKVGKNTITFFCGKQICYDFNWPNYFIYSFTVRVYYNKDAKKYVAGKIRKANSGDSDTAYNLIEFKTDVDDPSQVKSVEYIGYYQDYDLDGDGKPAGWHYTFDNGTWNNIIGKQLTTPYPQQWENYWVPEQNGSIKVIAKINSKNGLSYLTQPVIFDKLRQPNSTVKIYQTENLGENFSSRVEEKKECNIKITDDLSNAISAYLVVSCWSGEPEDGAKHTIGINNKTLAESPGKLHDWVLIKIPVPLEYLKTGDNTFFVYSETKEHAFEINYPGPAILIRYPSKDHPAE